MPYLLTILLLAFSFSVHASGTLSTEEVDAVTKADLETEQLSVVAGYLAQYEIKAKKLVDGLDKPELTLNKLNNQTTDLLNLSLKVFDSARFRLPQCDAYLAQTMVLTKQLNSISHESLENNFHHDGALPEAPAECYHAKDLLVHPATVLVLTRDDPGLSQATRTSIDGEISEVLTHLELVRQLVIY